MQMDASDQVRDEIIRLIMAYTDSDRTDVGKLADDILVVITAAAAAADPPHTL